MSILELTWMNLNWTPWVRFEHPDYTLLPPNPGVYRVKPVGLNELFYIGQTGRNLRERLRDLIRNTTGNATQMPYNDPHTAAPSLWAWRDDSGINFECSASSTSLLESERKALECNLLWQYRLFQGQSTQCNHGRFHPNYSKSGDRSTRYRGYRLLEGRVNPAGGPSLPPLHLRGLPHEENWMGLNWSQLHHLHNVSLQYVPDNPGVYKILDGDTSQLLYVGQSSRLKRRFQDHYRKSWECLNPVYSFSTLPLDILTYQLCEIENDLIGGYFHLTQLSPKFQFKNNKYSSQKPGHLI